MGIADNQNQNTDNSDQQNTGTTTGAETTTGAGDSTFTWKSQLEGDLSKAPMLSKFEDTKEGFNKFTESHYNLEKLLGNEKVPIPKDANDKEGWARFNKAMGIPDKPDGYKLSDVKMPESIKNMAFDKKQFAEVIHSIHATPSQAEGLWKAYTKMTTDAYGKALETQRANMTKVVNELKQEWGDAYDGNVQLGEMIINKFSPDKESADELVATFLTNPKAIRFLQKIGEQFQENKLPGFENKQFGLSPADADSEITKIMNDPLHPYNNPKASSKEHDAAVLYVNNLIAVKIKGQG